MMKGKSMAAILLVTALGLPPVEDRARVRLHRRKQRRKRRQEKQAGEQSEEADGDDLPGRCP